MKHKLYLAALLSVILSLTACNNDTTSDEVYTTTVTEETSAIKKALTDYQAVVLAQKDGFVAAVKTNTLDAYFKCDDIELDLGMSYADYEFDAIYPCYNWVSDLFYTIVILHNAAGDKVVFDISTSADFTTVIDMRCRNIRARVLGEAEEPSSIDTLTQQPYTPDYSFHTVEAPEGIEHTESESEPESTETESSVESTESSNSDSESKPEEMHEGTVESAETSSEPVDNDASDSEDTSNTDDVESKPVSGERGTAEVGGDAE